jgi:flagellar basal-body rod modification protein FlgD
MTTPITSTSSAGLDAASLAGAGISGGTSATQDQFLKLFVAQLEHQDPLNPQAGADMVAQLAQLSSLEQQVETNKRLGTLATGQDATTSAALAGLVGKQATVNASSVQLDGTPPPLSVKVDGAIASGTVTIKNASGAVVSTYPLPSGPGPFTVPWTAPGAPPLPAGAYSVTVSVTGMNGSAVKATPEITQTIDGIELGASGTQLRLGHALVNPADVLAIGANGGTP